MQARVSSLSPEHDSPPKAGGRLVHVLDLFCTPPPHVTAQSLQSFQSDQLPSTAKRIFNEIEVQRKGQNFRPPENHKHFYNTTHFTQTRNFITCRSSAQFLQGMVIHLMLRRSISILYSFNKRDRTVTSAMPFTISAINHNNDIA